MSEDEKRSGVFMTLLSLLFASVFVNIFQEWTHWAEAARHAAVCDTIQVTDTIRDTVTITLPAPVSVTPVRREVVRLAAGAKAKETDGIRADTIRDTITLDIPITQKRYEGDGYEAFVSGYMQSLDSLHIRRESLITTRTVTNTLKAPRLNVSAGVGCGISTRGEVRPFVGVMVGYRLF